MIGLWKFLPWWFCSSSWQIDSDSFQFSKFEFHCLHVTKNKILPCEFRSYWHFMVEIRHWVPNVCVHGFMSTSLFIFVAEENNGQIRKGGEPSRHILQKVMLLCFKLMFLVACKVGVIQSSRNLCTCSFPRVWEKEPKWLCGKGFWATAQNSFQQPPQDQSHFTCSGCKKTTLTPTKSSQMW